MGRKAVKMRTAASRARKKAQRSEPVELSDSESPADINLSGSESPAAVESDVVDDDFAVIATTEVSHYLKDLELRTHQHAHQLTSKTVTRKTRQPARKDTAQAPSQARKKSTCESGEPEAPLQVRNKPTRKSAQAVASLCQRLAREDSADDLEELPAADEYDETQESDVAVTSNTDAIATGVSTASGKLAEKSKVAKGKHTAVKVRNSDDNDTDDSAEEVEGKYLDSDCDDQLTSV